MGRRRGSQHSRPRMPETLCSHGGRHSPSSWLPRSGRARLWSGMWRRFLMMERGPESPTSLGLPGRRSCREGNLRIRKELSTIFPKQAEGEVTGWSAGGRRLEAGRGGAGANGEFFERKLHRAMIPLAKSSK